MFFAALGFLWLGACCGPVRSAPPLVDDRPLLQRATRIIEMRTYKLAPPRHYVWVTSTSVLLWQAKTNFPLVLLDTRTQKQIPMKRLGRLARRYFIRFDSVSPDGQWVLCQSPKFNMDYVVAIRLDGSRMIKRYLSERDRIGNVCWMPDSLRWVLLKWESPNVYGLVQSLERPGVVRKVNMGSIQGFDPIWDNPTGTVLGPLGKQDVLAYGSGRSTWWSAGIHADTNLGYFCVFNIGKRPSPPKPFTLRVPLGDEVHSVRLSPDGKRLAWIVYRVRLTKDQVVYNAMELQVHRLDGSEKKVVGRVTFPDSELLPEVPDRLRWVPDSRHLSFLYKGALWTIPVD